nr:hypothetical protein Iba_chr03bCG7690 [Ipomoea batatas]
MVCCGWANLLPQPPELKIKATGNAAADLKWNRQHWTEVHIGKRKTGITWARRQAAPEIWVPLHLRSVNIEGAAPQICKYRCTSFHRLPWVTALIDEAQQWLQFSSSEVDDIPPSAAVACDATAACKRTSGGVPLFPAPMAELSGGGFSPLLLVDGNRGAVAVMQQLSDVLSIAGRRRSVSSSPSRTSMAPSLRDGTPSNGIPLFPDDARWRTAATALLSCQA